MRGRRENFGRVAFASFFRVRLRLGRARFVPEWVDGTRARSGGLTQKKLTVAVVSEKKTGSRDGEVMRDGWKRALVMGGDDAISG